MTLDMDIAGGERTEAARNLMDRAQAGPVELVMVTALELCWLGGPAHPLFDEVPARAWTGPQRGQVMEQAARGLIGRGLITSSRTSPEQPIQACALKPELGLVLAARRRPAFVVIVQAEDHYPRTLRLFALGDEAAPVRGFVLEMPGLPLNPERHFAEVGKLGPLGWFYRYVLVSPGTAADALARWTVFPPPLPRASACSGWLVSVWPADRENPAGNRLRIRGDGVQAGLDGLAQGAPAQHHVEGLRAVMLELLTSWTGR